MIEETFQIVNMNGVAFITSTTLSRESAGSLTDKWQGPCRVPAKVLGLQYKLGHCETGVESGPINVDDVKLFFARPEDYDTLRAPSLHHRCIAINFGYIVDGFW